MATNKAQVYTTIPKPVEADYEAWAREEAVSKAAMFRRAVMYYHRHVLKRNLQTVEAANVAA